MKKIRIVDYTDCSLFFTLRTPSGDINTTLPLSTSDTLAETLSYLLELFEMDIEAGLEVEECVMC